VLRKIVISVFVCSLAAGEASAQNWSFDARKVGMGSPGSGENLASKMITEESDYRAIVLPFGLLQVFRDFDRLDPTKDDFDIIRTMEYAASPLHYTIGRNSVETGQVSTSSALNNFVIDIRNAELSRDLNRYRGFAPFDQQLIDVLGSATDVYIPDAQMRIGSGTRAQMALAIIGGYRGRFALANASSDRDGIYVAANYNHLQAMRYENVNLALRLDTDRAGLLAVNPLLPSPLVVSRDKADAGTGRAIDVGIGIVMNRWETGVGINGIANTIKWTDVERVSYSMGNPFLGDSDFVESLPQFLGNVDAELPVDYRGNIGYRADNWTAVAEAGHGYGGNSFHGGYEHRFGVLALRGGGIYSREMWNPSGGFGYNLTPRFGVDMAMYSNAANVERKRRPAIAVSLRFNH
jgi:hypothetical protein